MVNPAQLFLTQCQSRLLKFLNNIVGGYNSKTPKVVYERRVKALIFFVPSFVVSIGTFPFINAPDL